MKHYQHCLLWLWFAVATCSATELTNQTPLKQDQALDADGNPLPMPTSFAPALEYNAQEAQVKPLTATKKTSRKTRNNKVISIADDPSCRWLNSRMNELTKRIDAGSRIASYLQEEMTQHRQQWRCLKCDATGPAAGDHARCGL